MAKVSLSHFLWPHELNLALPRNFFSKSYDPIGYKEARIWNSTDPQTKPNTWLWSWRLVYAVSASPWWRPSFLPPNHRVLHLFIRLSQEIRRHWKSTSSPGIIFPRDFNFRFLVNETFKFLRPREWGCNWDSKHSNDLRFGEADLGLQFLKSY